MQFINLFACLVLAFFPAVGWSESTEPVEFELEISQASVSCFQNDLLISAYHLFRKGTDRSRAWVGAYVPEGPACRVKRALLAEASILGGKMRAIYTVNQSIEKVCHGRFGEICKDELAYRVNVMLPTNSTGKIQLSNKVYYPLQRSY